MQSNYMIWIILDLNQMSYHVMTSMMQSQVVFYSSLNKDMGAVSIRKTVLPGMAIPMLKRRRPNGRLIFNMEIAIRR